MKKIIPIIMAGFLLFAGCGDRAPGSVSGDGSPEPERVSEDGTPAAGGISLKEKINLDLKPNEAGKIMVLMYHNIGDQEAEWVRTPDNFLKDMEALYEKGYRPVSLKDYVSGNISTEQGFTPVVITFDDGNLNNFEYLENGQISEKCAVALLIGFHEKHADFPLEATFFVYGEQPFRQNRLIEEKLSFIVANGMDIGNHTKDHSSFKNLSGPEIQEQIGWEAQYLKKTIGLADYEIDSLALPFGERPKDETLRKYLAAGSYNGVPYGNAAILNVGWNPAFSPYDNNFDPASIPRIRASEMKVDNVGLYNYLDYFDRHPGERFISDGIAEVITVPEDKKESVHAAGNQEIYTYSPM